MAGPPVYVSTVYAAPMSCPAPAGAAETANGAVERMVLLGLTGVYYIISAVMRLWCGRNQTAAESAVCATSTSTPSTPVSRSAMRSAKYTERCWPPVQPKAT